MVLASERRQRLPDAQREEVAESGTAVSADAIDLSEDVVSTLKPATSAEAGDFCVDWQLAVASQAADR